MRAEIKVNGENNVIVELEISTSKLDEVQIIAYGTSSQRFRDRNVASVKAKDIEKSPVNNPLLALQGRVPGLNITQANGFPGSAIKVRIQGQNSVISGNAPLYVVDGVPYPHEIPPGLGIGPVESSESVKNRPSGTGSALSLINLSDIESIDVLKDADATAIYGSRAANGAILITTKKGKAGKMALDVNFQQGWGKATRKLNMLNSQQYLEMRWEAFKNDKIQPDKDNAPDLFVWDTSRYTDGQKYFFGNVSQFTNVNIGLSGGNENFQYLLRGTLQRETTILPGDFNDRKGSFHFNINSISYNRKFIIQFTSSYLADVNYLPNSDISTNVVTMSPISPPFFNEDGSLNWALNPDGASTWNNPYAGLYNTAKFRTNNLISNLRLSYSIFKRLFFRTSLGV